MRVLGIDPGSSRSQPTSGWAAVEIQDTGRVKLLDVGVVRCVRFGRKRSLMSDRMREILAPYAVTDAGAPYIAIEGQFLPSDGGKGGKKRAHAVEALGLSYVHGAWASLADAMGYVVLNWDNSWGIPVNVWRSAVYGRGAKVRTRGEAKAWALKMAKLLYWVDLPKSKDHAAEAIHIAAFAAERVRADNKTGRHGR